MDKVYEALFETEELKPRVCQFHLLLTEWARVIKSLTMSDLGDQRLCVAIMYFSHILECSMSDFD